MRKFTVIITILITILLALPSCGAASINREEIVQILESGFNAELQISYRNLEIAATLTSPKVGGESIEIHSPPSLAGLTANFSAGTPTITHQGLTAELTNTDIPLTSALTAIINTLNAARSNEIAISQTQNLITAKGRGLSGNFTLTFTEDLTLKSIEIRQINLIANVTNLTHIN